MTKHDHFKDMVFCIVSISFVLKHTKFCRVLKATIFKQRTIWDKNYISFSKALTL